MEKYKWIDDPRGTKEHHWIDLIGDVGEDDSLGMCYWDKASVKFDGCIHFYEAGNVPYCDYYGHTDSDTRSKEGECDSYLHICDLDKLIDQLTELRNKAKEHFGENWGDD